MFLWNTVNPGFRRHSKRRPKIGFQDQLRLNAGQKDCRMTRRKKRRPKIGFQDQLPLNAGQKYCRMLQGEHSAILLTCIKLPYIIKIYVLSICEWPLKTGFTVLLLF